MKTCSLCPNACNIDRNIQFGACGAPSNPVISKYYLHPYEEPCISVGKGSGTVFFSGCSLKCPFCQNFEISHTLKGLSVSAPRLSEIFCELENMGAANINLVNPTHFSDKIYEAIKIRKPNIPVVYNTHGYETHDGVLLAEKYSDIFLPDMKYFSPAASMRYIGKSDYFSVASKAIELMNKLRKTTFNGDLMTSGVIVRHLVLPLGSADGVKIVEWFSSLGSNPYFSLMAQYTPTGNIAAFPELNRRITSREYEKVYNRIIDLNIDNCFIQKRDSAGKEFIPDWDL